MKKNIRNLKGSEAGSTIYVIGSGKSMEFVDPEFFRDKVAICVNETFTKFPSDYIVCKEMENVPFSFGSGRILVCSKYDCGNRKGAMNGGDGDFYYFDHLDNRLEEIDLSPLDSDDSLVVSFSTITSAIHFAYFLGAKSIIICGHDCGSLDGQFNYKGYVGQVPNAREKNQHVEYYPRFEPQTIKLAKELRRRGVGVYGFNPFINFNLEYHVYSKEV